MPSLVSHFKENRTAFEEAWSAILACGKMKDLLLAAHILRDDDVENASAPKPSIARGNPVTEAANKANIKIEFTIVKDTKLVLWITGAIPSQ